MEREREGMRCGELIVSCSFIILERRREGEGGRRRGEIETSKGATAVRETGHQTAWTIPPPL